MVKECPFRKFMRKFVTESCYIRYGQALSNGLRSFGCNASTKGGICFGTMDILA